ncbi:MAG: hypothetical protein ACKOZT_08120, partial [Cyanobium sp.]
MAVTQLSRPRGSLRQWLLGAGVVAVLAGYGVLLLASAWLADLDRREAHRQISGRLLALAARPATLAVAATAAGVAVWIEPQRQ